MLKIRAIKQKEKKYLPGLKLFSFASDILHASGIKVFFHQEEKSAIIGDQYLWTDGVIPYILGKYLFRAFPFDIWTLCLQISVSCSFRDLALEKVKNRRKYISFKYFIAVHFLWISMIKSKENYIALVYRVFQTCFSAVSC